MTLLRTPDAAMTNNGMFKDDVRLALLFIDSARHFKFNEVLPDTLLQEMETLSNEFPMKGWNVILPADSTAEDIEITVEIIDKQIEKFRFLKDFESLLQNDLGPCSLMVRDAIDRSIKLLKDCVIQLLKSVETVANKYSSNSDPANLDILLRHITLCELLARTDNDILVDSDMKFVTVGLMFKTIINNIGTSTKDKILIHDYDGILDDIKKFDVQNSQINVKVDEILKAVFIELHNQERDIEDRVSKFRSDTTCTKESEALIDELRDISDKLNLFVAHVNPTQFQSVKSVNDISTGVYQTMLSISRKGKSCIDSIQISLTVSTDMEAEERIIFAESMLLRLEKLTDAITDASKAQDHLMSQVRSCTFFELLF